MRKLLKNWMRNQGVKQAISAKSSRIILAHNKHFGSQVENYT